MIGILILVLGVFVAERITSKFPSRLDWSFIQASGSAHMKLHQFKQDLED
jgi:hypothetical protein